jgi:hypothetical protein
MDKAELTRRVKQLALEAGFTTVGVASDDGRCCIGRAIH